jgi:hypothetical protein
MVPYIAENLWVSFFTTSDGCLVTVSCHLSRRQVRLSCEVNQLNTTPASFIQIERTELVKVVASM